MGKIEIFENSLKKKKQQLEVAFDDYFQDVKSANGQPLNDKRNGQQTFKRWERKEQKIRTIKDSIKKTEIALKKAIVKKNNKEAALKDMPEPIIQMLKNGVISQWPKHPTIFFVSGIDKARIQYKAGVLSHKYYNQCSEEQKKVFRKVFNELHRKINNKC